MSSIVVSGLEYAPPGADVLFFDVGFGVSPGEHAAIVGPNGVGKSTISALLVRALAERSKEVVLAIDADPNVNLGEKLGVEVERSIGELREDLLRQADSLPSGVSKHELVRYQMALAKVEVKDSTC